MCGRYKVTPGEFSDLRLRINLEEIPLFKPRYNIAPTQQAPVLSDSDALDWLSGSEIEPDLSLLRPFQLS